MSLDRSRDYRREGVHLKGTHRQERVEGLMQCIERKGSTERSTKPFSVPLDLLTPETNGPKGACNIIQNHENLSWNFPYFSYVPIQNSRCISSARINAGIERNSFFFDPLRRSISRVWACNKINAR